jgi:phosphoserine phosphatase
MALDLVVQGPALDRGHIDRLRDLAGTEAADMQGAKCVRLRGVLRRDGVAAYCQGARLDHAFVEAGRRLADFRLLAMDMDSTLIAIECIDEIADMRGIKREVAAITESAMRGEIDFPESLRRRVALLAGLEEAALQRVYDERLRLSPGAELMLQGLKRNAVKTLLVSGGFSFFTERLKSRLGLDFTLSNTLEVADGRLTGRVLGPIVDGALKAARLRELASELGATREQLIAMGDGANDLPMLAEAGVSIAYHAKPVVRSQATFCLDHVGLDGLLALFPA